ncbi:hypothetical protein CRENPOLYSF1_550020 [Crenothrix polyspora]|uniref:Uncharacterized protein n=1 Tax=Crenothrix polyspora TaxID=360316 RepID=A0A1R4HE84_9GAMM|nr:hypothetical protein CRENPOLYSF1_550020 [Crenothrix polyspora]
MLNGIVCLQKNNRLVRQGLLYDEILCSATTKISAKASNTLT